MAKHNSNLIVSLLLKYSPDICILTISGINYSYSLHNPTQYMDVTII